MSRLRHTLVVHHKSDPRNHSLLADAHALGLTRITGIECSDLYFAEGHLTEPDLKRLAAELLSDPIVQTSEWRSVNGDQKPGSSIKPGFSVIETALRPGVTDPVADQIVRAANEIGLPVQHAATGSRYAVSGRLTPRDLHTLATRLLANPVVHRYELGCITPIFPLPAQASGQVEFVPLRELDSDELLALSRDRRAALDLPEMQAVQNYYRAEGRDPTDVEFEMIAQTWSEHCVHKTFKARIELSTQHSALSTQIDGLLRTFLRSATEEINAPWVRSAFVDNAGIIDFDDEYEISFKVETHNHPSAIEPFGGANTGVGGVVRDILGVSAKPIAATDILCFGPQNVDPDSLPEGVLHPRRIRSGVVAGIQDYGNKIGIPTINGAILYDHGYTANPLVFCGCVGIAPKGRHAKLRNPQAGDRVIVLGGRTGRDGLRGATFSSMAMDAQTGEVAGASVQIGDPITEKSLIEVITRARDLDLYHAITDCGAGGLSSAVGEMASVCGADVELSRVRLKYPGLAPWEIWLSEAQERMVLAVPDSAIPLLGSLCDTYNVELTDIGAFTATNHLVVRYTDKVVLDLANDFLRNGLPQRRLTAVSPCPVLPGRTRERRGGGNCSEALLNLLACPNIASKASVIRVYDHEVQGGTVVKPLTGAKNDGPSDASVLKPVGTKGMRGIVLSNGINPELGKHDPYRMSWSAVDEAIRNAVAVGADPNRTALLDNFCWGDPARPETLGALVEAVRGCHDAALHFGAPFISGKDSLNNEYLGADGQRHAIPPTLLISAISVIEDVSKAVTMDLKEAGNALYLLGTISSLQSPLAYSTGQATPDPLLRTHNQYRALHRAMQSGLVCSCHDLSEGGLAVAAAEMCIGGRLGLSITLPFFVGTVPMEDSLAMAGDGGAGLFAETDGCLLVEVRPTDCAKFETMFEGLPLTLLGLVTQAPKLNISIHSQSLLSVPLDDLVTAWQSES